MTENEVKETKEWLQDFIRMFSCNFDDLETRGFNECVIFLKELEQYRAVGTVEELQELKTENEELHCELQASNATMDLFEKEIREKAITEFAERLNKRLHCAFSDDLEIQKYVDEIAEELRGAE